MRRRLGRHRGDLAPELQSVRHDEVGPALRTVLTTKWSLVSVAVSITPSSLCGSGSLLR
jgi:hypothetical protein